jgi:hypothetical protein
MVEYSESLDELEASAVREDEQALRGTFRVIGLLLGAAGTYGLLKLYGADWPKIIRFIAVLVGAYSGAFVFCPPRGCATHDAFYCRCSSCPRRNRLLGMENGVVD